MLIKVKPNNYDILAGRVKMQSIFDVPLIEIKHDLMPVWQFTLKRMFDVVISLSALFLLSPLFLLSTILVKIGSQGPVFFYQERIGIHGDLFKIIKFRSMFIDAEKNGPQLSSDSDPRITKWGNIMRRYRIDELPQFWNVLKGDMSIVGPRPLFDEDTKLFNETYMRRLNVLPGLTGLLQINERNTDQFSTWYKYDMEYIDNWSLLLDLKIILKTPFSIFTSKIQGE